MHYATIKELEDVAHYYIDLSCREVCKLTDLHDFDLAFIKLDWSKRRSCSRGGWYPRQGGAGISIGMNLIAKNQKDSVIRVYEYKSFDSSKTIGGFFTRNIEHKLALHCLHEVAHAAQYWGFYLKNISPGSAHGNRWKSIYEHLRVNILNSSLPEQEPLQKEYNNIIEEIESPLQRKLILASRKTKNSRAASSGF
jgi:hypothetical protein